MSVTTEALHSLLSAAESALPMIEDETKDRELWARACPAPNRPLADKRRLAAEHVLAHLCAAITNARCADREIW